MRRFPILRLPLVALQEVLKCINPIHLFLLSQCSTRLAGLVSIANTHKWKLTITGNRHIEINGNYYIEIAKKVLRNQGLPFKIGPQNQEIIVEGALIPSITPSMIFYVENRVDGLLNVAFHLSTLFKCGIKRFVIPRGLYEDHSVLILCKIAQHQGNTIEELVFNRFSTLKELKWVMNHIIVTKKLKVYGDLQEEFVFNQSPKKISINAGSWVTMDTLKSLTSSFMITVSGAKLFSRDLDEFVGLWKAGMFSKLDFLRVQGSPLRGEIAGFTMEQHQSERNDRRIKKLDGCDEWICNGGVDIERGDGRTKATIQVFSDSDFMFFVWKD